MISDTLIRHSTQTNWVNLLLIEITISKTLYPNSLLFNFRVIRATSCESKSRSHYYTSYISLILYFYAFSSIDLMGAWTFISSMHVCLKENCGHGFKGTFYNYKLHYLKKNIFYSLENKKFSHLLLNENHVLLLFKHPPIMLNYFYCSTRVSCITQNNELSIKNKHNHNTCTN